MKDSPPATLRCSRLLAALLVTAACNCGGRTLGEGSESRAHEPQSPTDDARLEIDVFAFGRQLGAIAPCGCTTDPLGGLQFAFGYMAAESKPGQRLVIEPGSFLYPDPLGPQAPDSEAAWLQAERRASLLRGRFAPLDALVSGVGPTDVSSPAGAAALETHPLPRVLGNALALPSDMATVEPWRRVDVGRGIAAGVTAVIDPQYAAHLEASGLPSLTDPVAAAKEQVTAMRSDGTRLEIVMVQGPRALAEQIARDVDGVDLVVMGGALEGAERSRLGSPPMQVGQAWLLEPGDQAQTVSHVTLSMAAEATASDEPLPSAPTWEVIASASTQREQLARLDEQLAKFEKDPDADAGFIANLKRQRGELAASMNATATGLVAATFEQAKIHCRLPADAQAERALADYDAWVASENQKRFAGVEAPAPAKGQPGYIGRDECSNCHEEAATFWSGTVHARAYQTLVSANKQFDLSCVSCHVTGFRKPGGSEVVETHGLTDVQCEQCHGPGSLHAEDPDAVLLPAETPVTVCGECHTPEHSDTFQYEAYLRDILGDGHGLEARRALGNGPTGAALRAAGLEKAGGGCKK